MLFYTGLFFLVIAVSLDGFTVGLAYGMQKIKIPRSSLIIIMILSGTVVLVSMMLGSLISPFISINHAARLGGSILIILGIFALYNVCRGKANGQIKQNLSPSSIPNMRTILRKPEEADVDRSGIISLKESFFLGIALALDAFGAGFAAAMLNYSPILTAVLMASMSGLFLYSGLIVGEYMLRQKILQKLIYTPGLLLMTIGLINLFN